RIPGDLRRRDLDDRRSQVRRLQVASDPTLHAASRRSAIQHGITALGVRCRLQTQGPYPRSIDEARNDFRIEMYRGEDTQSYDGPEASALGLDPDSRLEAATNGNDRANPPLPGG